VVAAVGTAGLIGAFGGTAAGRELPEPLTLAIFAFLMVLAGVRMLRPWRAAVADASRPSLWPLRATAVGLVAGFLTGLLGLGGGFIVIPLLMLVLHVPFRLAVGTSLAVTVLNASSGLLAHWGAAQLDWVLTAGFGCATVVAALVGARFAARVPSEKLQRGFALLVLLLAGFTLVRSILAW